MWALPACGIVMVFPEVAPAWATTTALVACAALMIWKAIVVRRHYQIWLLPAVVLMGGLVSSSLSVNPEVSRQKMALLVLGMTTLVLFGFRQAEDTVGFLRGWGVAFLLGMATLALIGPLFLSMDPPLELAGVAIWETRLMEVPEDLHRNTLAGLLAMAVTLNAAFLAAAARYRSSRQELVLLSTLGGVLLLMLLATKSRGAAVAGLLGISVILVVGIGRRFALPVVLGWSALAVAALGSFVIYGLPDGMLSRLELWDRSLQALQVLPFTGGGPGAFSKLIPDLFPLYSYSPDATPPHAHSLPLQAALDLGLPGLIAVTTLAFGVLAAGARKIRSKSGGGNGELRLVLLGYELSLVTVLVQGLVDSPLWLNKPHPLIFFTAGMILCGPPPDPERSRRLHPELAGAARTLVYWVGCSLVAVTIAVSSPLAAVVAALVAGAWIGIREGWRWRLH